MKAGRSKIPASSPGIDLNYIPLLDTARRESTVDPGYLDTDSTESHELDEGAGSEIDRRALACLLLQHLSK